MKLKLPTTSNLSSKPASFLREFYKAVGPEAEALLTPEVLKALAINPDASVSEAVAQWKKPFIGVQNLCAHKDMTPEEIGSAMNDLKKEPHGELAFSVSENHAPGIDID